MLHFKNVFFIFAEITFDKRPLVGADSAADVHECENNMLNLLNNAYEKKTLLFFRDHLVVSRTGICAEPQHHR